MATRIELSLKEDGHTVFFSHSSLPPGEGFDAQIRAAVGKSDLFIFLISRESVAPGRYTLTELKFAERKWGQPAGHVLPVLIEPVPTDAIPAFLRAVTILHAEGNVAAEVAAEAARMSTSWWRILHPRRLVPVIVALLVLVGGAWAGLSWYSSSIVTRGRLLGSSGDYASAWMFFERARVAAVVSSAVREAQEQLAMDWLDNARSAQLAGTKLGSTLGDLANTVLPVLARGAAAAKGQRAADLLAHMGWADFFRSRDGVNGLDPTQYYRRAIEIDPKNVFAHAMWGHWILATKGSLAEAKQHFAIAVTSERKREFVRMLQFAALLWFRTPDQDIEAIRVANEIRSNAEKMPVSIPDRPEAWELWGIYQDRLIRNERKLQFLQGLPPADHLATFRWLYPVESVKTQADTSKYYLYLSMLAQLQEYTGDRAGALESYRLVQGVLAGKVYGYMAIPVLTDANAAIKRLSN